MSSSGFGSTKALLKAFDRVSIYDRLEKKRHILCPYFILIVQRSGLNDVNQSC